MKYRKKFLYRRRVYPADSRDTNPELIVLLEEYQALRAEIVAIEEMARQYISTSYVALGILGAGVSFVIEKNLQALFLLFPLFLYGLAWSFARATLQVLRISDHLRTSTIPRIRDVLAREDSRQDYSRIMDWETHSKGFLRHYGWWALPVAGAHYGVMLLGGIISLLGYFVFPPAVPLPDWMLYSLVAINVLLVGYSIVIGFKTELGR